jgi:hypothetical protein
MKIPRDVLRNQPTARMVEISGFEAETRKNVLLASLADTCMSPRVSLSIVSHVGHGNEIATMLCTSNY